MDPVEIWKAKGWYAKTLRHKELGWEGHSVKKWSTNLQQTNDTDSGGGP
jgi:hypothetical protein